MGLKRKLTALILAASMLICTACSESTEAAESDLSSSESISTEDSSDTEKETVTSTTVKTVAATVSEEESEPTESTEADGDSTTSTVVTTAPLTVTTEQTTTVLTTTATTTRAATSATTTAKTTASAATTTTQASSASGETVQINALSLPSNVEKFVNDMGAGWNLGNSMDAYNSSGANETVWGNPKTTKALIDAVKAAGFNTVRIPVSYMGKVNDSNNYTIDSAWLDRLNEIVDYVIDNGMYAIINIHHDGNNDSGNGAWLDCSASDQTKIRAKFSRIWEQLAARFKNYGDHLIFESMNEIMEVNNYTTNISSSFYSNLNTLNQLFVDTVRASGGNNASRWLLIPGYNTNIDATVLSSFKLPADSASNKLIVSVHFYDPYSFTLEESSTVYKWGNNASSGNKASWGHEDYVEAQMQKLYNTFTSKGIPVIIGEYGAIDKTWVNSDSNSYRRYYFEYVAKSAVNHGCVPVYWDNGYDGKNGFALFNRSTGKVLYPELVSAIVRGATRSSYAIEIP